MTKLAYLILKNLGRNKVRTALTALAVVVLVAVYVVTSTITSKVRNQIANQASQTKLIVTERWVMPSRMPARYVGELTKLDGVDDWTVWHLYGGFFDESGAADKKGAGIATRIDNLTAMHEGLEGLDEATLAALREDKTGALVGSGVMSAMDWEVGQEFTFISSTHQGKNLRFRIVGVLPPGKWSRNFFFHDDYFQEATGDKENVNCVWLRVADSETAERVSARIQQLYENRQPALKVETESAGVARFAGRSEAVLSIIDLVVTVLLVDMVIILSNSISITIRERRGEMAVLKVLGFQPQHIVVLVVGEAMLVGGVGGLLGAALAWGSSQLITAGHLPASVVTNFFLSFPISSASLAWGLLIGSLIGLSGSLLPSWGARKVRVTDVFARIA